MIIFLNFESYFLCIYKDFIFKHEWKNGFESLFIEIYNTLFLY